MSTLHNRRRHDYRPKTLRLFWQFAENLLTTARWRFFAYAEGLYLFLQACLWIALFGLGLYLVAYLFGG